VWRGKRRGEKRATDIVTQENVSFRISGGKKKKIHELYPFPFLLYVGGERKKGKRETVEKNFPTCSGARREREKRKKGVWNSLILIAESGKRGKKNH